MAIKKIVEYGTSSLREPSKEVHKVSAKIKALISDMLDTMYHNNGVGLAAPQVGENIRLFIIDVSLKDEPLNPIVFINPKIIKKSGAMKGEEGCLSFPQAYTEVVRYKKVMVKALDRNGRPFVLEADGDLMARAIQHEFDHLEGILFIDHAVNRFAADEALAKYKLPPLDVNKMVDEKDLIAQLDNETKEA